MKKIQTKFSSVQTDQNRRIRFKKQELPNLIWKTIFSSQLLESSNKKEEIRNLPLYQKSKVKRDAFHSDKNSNNSSLISVKTRQKNLHNFYTSNLALKKKASKFFFKNGCFSRIRNRCILTGHPSTIGKFGLSRISFRRLAGLGKLPGFKK